MKNMLLFKRSMFFLLSISDEFSFKPFVILYLPLLASDYFLDNGKSLGTRDNLINFQLTVWFAAAA